jgi:hypothetical protein
MYSKVLLFVISALLGLSSVIAADNPEKEKQASSAIEKWLKAVDTENYSEVWADASDLLKRAVKKEQFESSLQTSRKAFGKFISRKEKSRTYKTTLPGAPDGEYIVFLFETSFENKKSALETVTAQLEKNGQWKTSGYYIK